MDAFTVSLEVFHPYLRMRMHMTEGTKGRGVNDNMGCLIKQWDWFGFGLGTSCSNHTPEEVLLLCASLESLYTVLFRDLFPVAESRV